MRMRKISPGAALAVVGLVAIVVATMTPARGAGDDGPPWCMSCPLFSDRAGVDLILNVLLYVPFGAGMAMLRRGPRHIAVVAFVISAVIETLQVNVIPGRFASVSDVVANTSGALLGLMGVRHWRGLVEPTPFRSRVLAGVAAVLALILLHLTMWAQQTVPMSEAMATRWWPSPGRDRVAAGANGESQITYLTLDGRTHEGRLRLTPNDAARLGRARGYDLEMGFVPAGHPGEQEPVFELVDGEGRRLLRVRQDGRHIAAELTTRARRLRLRTPAVRLRRVLPAEAVRARRGGLDTVHVAVHVGQGNLRMRARLGAKEAGAAHIRGAFVGWSLLIPQGSSSVRVRVLTVLWVAALVVPIAYWGVLGTPPSRPKLMGRTSERRQSPVSAAPFLFAGFLGLFLALALEVLPRVNDFKTAEWPDGLAAATAIGVGGWLAYRTGRRRASGVLPSDA